jgi:hypothetical protein
MNSGIYSGVLLELEQQEVQQLELELVLQLVVGLLEPVLL